MPKAILLDRDGTLNVDHGYVYKVEDFEWIPGVIPALKSLQQGGYLLIVISNQSGISRGYYTREDLEILEKYMVSELEKEGITIDGFYYCPHVNEDNCDCRKPKPFMADSAIKDFELIPSESWMIGDRIRDLQSAEAQGCNLVGVRTGEGSGEFSDSQYLHFPSLKECAEHILDS